MFFAITIFLFLALIIFFSASSFFFCIYKFCFPIYPPTKIQDLQDKLQAVEIDSKLNMDRIEEDLHNQKIQSKKLQLERDNVQKVLDKTSGSLFEARGDIERLQVDIKVNIFLFFVKN